MMRIARRCAEYKDDVRTALNDEFLTATAAIPASNKFYPITRF